MDGNLLIVSHSKRIRKLLYNYFINFDMKKRFKNCSILLINFNKLTEKTEIKLIYNGELDTNENRPDKNYYDINTFNNLGVYSDKLIVPDNINIFLIRHAQGYHNYNNTLYRKAIDYFEQKSLKDPQLTKVGKIQATNCGIFLNNYINQHNIDKTKFILFCSILLRTRETINNILDELAIFNDIYILPCSQEISHIKFPEILKANNGKCTSNPTDRILYQCDYVFSKMHKPRNIIWDHYKDFNDFNDFKDNHMCNKTNMIYEAYIIFVKLNFDDKEYIENIRKKLIV